MLIKAGVDISRLGPEIRKALNEISLSYTINNEELVITSTYEGNHSPGSKHYGNDAVDIRKPLKNKDNTLKTLKANLGKGFYVLEELSHIHINFIRS